MGFFGSPKIDGKELQECLAYFESQTKVVVFQTKEADIYNNTLVKYGNSIMENPAAAGEACKAARRLSLASAEVLKRHAEISSVPVAASAMHYAWYLTFLSNADWSSATAKAIEAMAEGMTPETIYLQKLVEAYQKAWRRADEEDKKFLKRLKVSADDIAQIIVRANTYVASDNWDPE